MVATKGLVAVYNVSSGNYKYMVARFALGKLWFWGGYETEEKARSVAFEIGGIVIERVVAEDGKEE